MFDTSNRLEPVQVKVPGANDAIEDGRFFPIQSEFEAVVFTVENSAGQAKPKIP